MVRLNNICADVASEILVKLEYLNPSGSLKDRIALEMIEKAEKSGEIKPGATIIESSTGLMFVAAPAYAGEATQIWKCEMSDDASEAEVKTMAQDWLKAAKTMKSGERLQAYVYFPVAVNVIGDTDVWFVVVAPSFEEWGKFWDNDSGSPADVVDKRNDEKVVCPDSGLWESIKIK